MTGKVESVMFRWSDNPSGTPLESRRLWVRDSAGDCRLLRFADLDELLGEPERRRLVKRAIRWGSARWHPVCAQALRRKLKGRGLRGPSNLDLLRGLGMEERRRPQRLTTIR